MYSINYRNSSNNKKVETLCFGQTLGMSKSKHVLPESFVKSSKGNWHNHSEFIGTPMIKVKMK